MANMADEKPGLPPSYAELNVSPATYPTQYPPQQQYPVNPQYPTAPVASYPLQQYQPPPGSVGYYPGAASTQQHSVIIVNPPTAVIVGPVGDVPTQITCPYCHNTIVTSIKYEVGGLCWLIVCLLFIFGLWPCCLIPFCVPSCKDVVHLCPSCHTVVGRHKRL